LRNFRVKLGGDDHGGKVDPIAAQLADSHWLLACGP
jgi:hypothetical protein